jgi:pimeloyl-ACP methyl ester carboxylesterase
MAPQDAPVVYLGRPCQYVIAGGANCDSKWWSTARYSDEVVAAVDRMVDRLLARHSAEGLILVGYSGGGAVAALLAARRRDVRGLVTIAANLDTEAWAELHRVSPLMDSVNPASRAADIGRTPQVHFAGAKDAIVPPAIIQSFMARLPSKSDAELVVEPAFDHKCCWSLEWERLRHTAEMLLLR